MDRVVAEVIWSADDGGYYVEIVDRHTGKTIETLPPGPTVYKKRASASRHGWTRARALNELCEG